MNPAIDKSSIFTNCFFDWLNNVGAKFLLNEGKETAITTIFEKAQLAYDQQHLFDLKTISMNPMTKICIEENFEAASTVAKCDTIEELATHWLPEEPGTRNLNKNAALLRAVIKSKNAEEVYKFFNLVEVKPDRGWFYLNKYEGGCLVSRLETPNCLLLEQLHGMKPQAFFRSFGAITRSQSLDYASEFSLNLAKAKGRRSNKFTSKQTRSQELAPKKIKFTAPEVVQKKPEEQYINAKGLTLEEQGELDFFLEEYSKLPKTGCHVYVPQDLKGLDGQVIAKGWHSQEVMTKESGFTLELQEAVQKEMGDFLFVLDFSNAHQTFHVTEPCIWMRDPLPGSSEEKVKFPNVEFYFQHCKRAMYASTIVDPAKQREVVAQFRKDIENPDYLDTCFAQSAGQNFEVAGHGYFDSDKWNEIKLSVMEHALSAKFTQNALLGEMLLALKDDARPFVQLKTDPIWGPGVDGKGANLLGVALKNVQTALSEGTDLPHPLTVASMQVAEEEELEQDEAKYLLSLDKNAQFALDAQDGEDPMRFKIMSHSMPSQIEGKSFVSDEKYLGWKCVGSAAAQGRRPTMEDAEIATSNVVTINGQEYPFDLVGVFDGHGGSQASAFVKQNIVAAFQKHVGNLDYFTDEGIYRALKAAFKDLDVNNFETEGTTVTVAITLGDKIWVANAGDSRTILVKENGETIQATEDASPNVPKFGNKIVKLGGFVYAGRVNGALAVARSIGDHQYLGATQPDGKRYKLVLPNPKITCFSLQDFIGGYIVLACDGLYDVASTNEVGAAIHQMARSGLSPKEIAQRCVHSAYLNGSTDNISVNIMKL